MEGRGRSRRRSLRREWKRRLSSVLAVVLTAVMILNMPLSIDGLGLHVSDAFASGSNADQEDSVWATASNAKYRQGDSQDVDIYVIANDSGAVPGNTTSMTLYLKNNTDQAISEGVLTFSGKYINKEDASFQDVGSGEEYSQIITAGGPGYSAEESGEGLIYQETDKTALLADETAEDVSVTETEAEAEQLPVLPEDPGDGEAEEEESEEAYKLENIDLQPGELHEVYFEFYTEDDVKSTKANVSFSFRGENEEGSRVTGDTKFYYSIGLPNVNFSMEDGMQIESGVKNDLEIWMSEPDWVDEDLEERLQEQEEKKAQEEMEQAEEEAEEDGNTGNTASGSDASRATDSNASKDNTASNSNAAKDDTSDGTLSKEDAEKIDKYTEEAMEISESKVSYTVEIFGAKYSDFHPRKTEEAEDIGWISCVYEVDRETEPGIYYGKVTATGKWNKKDFTTEQGFLFEVTGEGRTGQEFTEELDNVIVHAYAEEGVLPENVQLKVTELIENDAETGDQFQTAKDALDAEGTQYDGMMALDITFIDENGEEIEPDGEVQVSIEMKEGVLPEDVDLSTVEVHHLKEVDENTVEVEAVADGADKTDGTVKSADEVVAEMEDAETPEEEIEAAVSSDAAAVASFSVESFSYFTITWTYWEWGYETKSVNVYLIDNEGNELDPVGTHVGEFDVSANGRLTIAEEVPYVKNYNYKRAVLADNENAAIDKNTETYRLRLSDSNNIQYSNNTDERYPNWKNLTGNDKIYLIYSKDNTESAGGGGGNTETTLPEPSISKTAISNGDGTYNLNLSVTGSVGSQSSTVNVDVLMIVDESNSMYNDDLFSPLKEAMRSLIDTLERNEGVDARYGIVSFATTPQEELDEWTSMGEYDPDAANADQQFRNSKVGKVIASNIGKRWKDNDGGTNYMAGFRAAEGLLNTSNNDKERNAITVIVFLSDGDPTFYYPSHTSTTSTGYYTDSGWYQENSPLGIDSWMWRLTLEEADDLACDQFYSVGIGNASESYLNTNNELGGLVDVVNASGVSKYINAGTKGENLAKEFANIAGSVTDLYIENVTITDTVNTQNVKQVDDTTLSIKVTDASGTDVTNTEVTEGEIIAEYENGILTLDFDDKYGLKPGYTYTVTMQIQPTSDAEIYYARNESYPDGQQADNNTGTHSGEMGFFSNQKAELSFYYTDNEQAQGVQKILYPMPVVQVQKGYLKLSKVMADSTSAGNDSFTFLLSIPADYAGTYNALYSTDTTGTGTTLKFVENGLQAEAKVTLKATEYVIIALPSGIEVSISENVNGYTPSWSVDGTSSSGQSVNVNVKKGEFSNVICTNTVKISIPTGLYNDGKPYAVMFAGAVIILAGYSLNLYSRRRRCR